MLSVLSFQPSEPFRVFGVFRGSNTPFLCVASPVGRCRRFAPASAFGGLVFFVALPICVHSRSFAVKI
jgi:hypothetical protein